MTTWLHVITITCHLKLILEKMFVIRALNCMKCFSPKFQADWINLHNAHANTLFWVPFFH